MAEFYDPKTLAVKEISGTGFPPTSAAIRANLTPRFRENGVRRGVFLALTLCYHSMVPPAADSPSPADPFPDPVALAPLPQKDAVDQSSSQMPPPLPRHPKGSAQKTHPFLQAVANGYLICFCLEGLLEFASQFPAITQALPALEALSKWAALSVTIAFITQVLLMSSYRHLPWRELSLVLLVTFWSRFLYLPLPGLFDWENIEFLGAGLTLVTAGVTIGMIRLHRGTLGIPKRAFEDVEFSLGRTMIAFLFKLGVLFPFAVLYVGWSCNVMVNWRTHGFLHLNLQSLKAEARTYERDGKKVYLLPTMHVASPSFYSKLMEGLPSQKCVLLPEGVSDRKGLLKARWSYAGPAKSAGLSVQPDFSRKTPNTELRVCDADISEFSASTTEILNTVATHLQRWGEGDLLGALDGLSKCNFQKKDLKQLQQDVLELRNAKVLTAIRKSLPTCDHVLVPWGALHMPGIEAALLKEGFQRSAGREIEMLAWGDVLNRVRQEVEP